MDDALNPYLLLFYLAPLSMGAVALLALWRPGRQPWGVYRAALAAAALALLLSLGAALAVWQFGAQTGRLPLVGPLALALRLDVLSVTLLWLVATIGLFVIQFSRNYLDGDERHGAFFGALCLTIGAVFLLVLAGNLSQLVLAWIATSLALHRLLLFYRARPAAQSAARKKYIVARAGDLCLLLAAVLLVRSFGSGDLAALSAAAGAARAADAVPAGAVAAALLVTLAALLKSATFPFHGWLLEVMETPTPVSALLHAGLINAGTFLVVRLGDVLFLTPVALYLLIVVGGFTAIFASSAMIAQSSVKVSLAYSSAAHMGFMLMLCGFGAHGVAILHLVAHSFYKAHAFLASGSILEYVGAHGPQRKLATARAGRLPLALLGALAIFVALGTLLGIELTKRPAEMALGAIFVLAMTQLLVQGMQDTSRGMQDASNRQVVVRTAAAAVATTLAFFALELTGLWLFAAAVATYPSPSAPMLVLMGIVVAAFALIIVAQALLPHWRQTALGRAVYVHLKHGLYVNALFDRLLGSARRP